MEKFNFEAWKDLKKSEMTDGKKEISEDLVIDDNNENDEEVLEEFKAGDDVDLNSEELEAELAKELDEEENKIPYNSKLEGKLFISKASMKNKNGVVGTEGNATKHSGKRSNKNKIRKIGNDAIRRVFKKVS